MKNKCVIYAPVETYSGYGSNARDKVKAIIELKKDEWDIKIISCGWGNTPMGFLDENEEWRWLKSYILPSPLNYKPDYMFWITIPSEAQALGRWNCLITAGIETTVSPGDWIEGINRMDLTLTSSEHSKNTFINTVLAKVDQRTNQQLGEVKVEKPLEVLFEGANLDVYKSINKSEVTNINLDSIKESFCYLFLGHWIGGDIGEDRKNVGLLIKAFYEIFKDKKQKPALILKTCQVGSSYMDRDEILKKIKAIQSTVNSKDLPNVYLLHGEFSDSEINELYNHPKVKAMVSLTKGEGFGRPLLEFSLTKKPIIATGWSGHIDFLRPNMSVLLPGTFTNVHPSAANQWLLKDSQWFSVDTSQLGIYLKDMFENYKNYTERGKMQAAYSRNNFSFDKMKEKMDELFTKYIPEFPKEVKLQLPTLKKIELPKLKKVEENG